MLPDEAPKSEESGDEIHHERLIGLARRREMPQFVICDWFMRVVSSSSDVKPALKEPGALRTLEPLCRESLKMKSTSYFAFDNDTVLRISPLNDELDGCVVIFVDSFNRRGPVYEAAKEFGLTKRESEVLQLAIRADSNSDIAKALCIAESTVEDHLQSLMRKMKVSKRGQLVSRVFRLEHDLNAEQRPE